MGGRVRYTAEFKQKAVILSRRVGVVKAARDLGVSAGALDRWRALDDPSESPQFSTDPEKENRRIRRELKHAQAVIEVLKNAPLVFEKNKKSKKQNFC